MASSKTQVDSTWATPKTWSTGDPLTATNMNDELRDELNAVKTPGHAYGIVDEAADVTSNSTSFVAIDATNLSMTFVTSGGVVHVWFLVTAFYSAGAGTHIVSFNIYVDGSAWAANDGICQVPILSGGTPGFQTVLVCADVSGLSAASHTFTLYWKTDTGTNGIYMGAATANHDVHPQMGAIEIT